MARTGRKTIANKATRDRALSIAKANPSMPASAIAERMGVTARQVQYWLNCDKEKAKEKDK